MFSASMKPATRCVTLPASPQWGRKVKVGNDRSLKKKKIISVNETVHV